MFSSGWPSSGRNDWAGALFVRLPFSGPLQESLIHLPHPCPIPLGEGVAHFVLRHSLFDIGFSQPLHCSGYLTSNKSSPTKLTSSRPGGPGKTTVTSFSPFPALPGICSVPRILVRDVRDNPVRSIPAMLTLEGRICNGGNGGCALPFNVTVTVNRFPTKPLPGVTWITPSLPPPGWPPPPPVGHLRPHQLHWECRGTWPENTGTPL